MFFFKFVQKKFNIYFVRYLKNFDTIFRATEDELNIDWDYYNCTNCHSDFRLFKPKKMKCPYCQSVDLTLLDKTKQSEYEKNQ